MYEAIKTIQNIHVMGTNNFFVIFLVKPHTGVLNLWYCGLQVTGQVNFVLYHAKSSISPQNG